MSLTGIFFLIVSLMVTLSFVSDAKEGFQTSILGAPKSIVAAWDATFAIITDLPNNYSIGTAFLIGEENSNSIQNLYFLTVNHVVNPSCETNKTCPGTFLVKNIRARQNVKGQFTVEPLEGLFDQVDVISRAVNPDIALLRVKTRFHREFNPISLPSNCDLSVGATLYSIGFPSTSDRTNPSALSISEKEIETKRWSQGIYVDRFHKSDDTGRRLYIGTTTDSLSGVSGGPILNEFGEAVSISVKSSSTSENQYQYLGNENLKNLDWQTLGIRCEVLKDLGERMKQDKLKPSN